MTGKCPVRFATAKTYARMLPLAPKGISVNLCPRYDNDHGSHDDHSGQSAPILHPWVPPKCNKVAFRGTVAGELHLPFQVRGGPGSEQPSCFRGSGRVFHPRGSLRQNEGE